MEQTYNFAAMNAWSVWPRILSLELVWVLSSCSSDQGVSNANGAAGHANSRASSLYGSLAPVRSLKNFRNLQDSLQGQNMKRVVDKLGSPAGVENFGGSESWQYNDLAFDPVTKRPVRVLTVWFEKGVVDDIRASF